MSTTLDREAVSAVNTKAAAAAVALRAEAKAILGSFITDQGQADRFVDCVIGAAMLEISVWQAEAVAKACQR